MLKYIKGHMETIAGIEIYPLVSFIIFFTFFVLLFIWVIRMTKEEVHTLSQLPFQKSDELDANNSINTKNF